MPITLRDIARHLNLSHATVSLVINGRQDVAIPESTRNRVLEAVKELGYRPNRAARALSKGKTQMISLWIPSTYNTYYAQILQTMQRLISHSGYDMVFCSATSEPEDRELKLATLCSPADAILAIDCLPTIESLVADADLHDRPVVGIGSYRSAHRDCVSVDLAPGAEEAMAHLIGQGRRRIVLVRPEDPLEGEPRDRVYHSALSAAGLSPEVLTLGSDRRALVHEVLTDYVHRHGAPDAFFCHNDHIALVALRVLKELGAGSCAVVGCDGLEESLYSNPSLSTIVQPVEQMCELGWRFTLDRLKDPQLPPQKAELAARLAVRESSS